jgi:hypothetical protein
MDGVVILSLLYGVVYSEVVLMKVAYAFARVCLQRVHVSFLRTLSYLKVQLLYLMVKS